MVVFELGMNRQAEKSSFSPMADLLHRQNRFRRQARLWMQEPDPSFWYDFVGKRERGLSAMVPAVL